MDNEKVNSIIEAYKRGDKTSIIYLNYKINSGFLYRILKEANVPLRSNDPTHPASSMATRRATGMFPHTVPDTVKIQEPFAQSPASPKSLGCESFERDLKEIKKDVSEAIECLNNLLARGFLDEDFKVDIVYAYLTSVQWRHDRDLARKLVNVIEALNGI